MILPFSLFFKDKKTTNFVEKIWQCLLFNTSAAKVLWEGDMEYAMSLHIECREKNLLDANSNCSANSITPKLHTIREDKKNRWKVGNKIHFTVHNRTKDSFRFAPVIPAQSTQNIVIYSLGSMAANGSGIMVLIDNKHFGRWNYGAEPDCNRGAENIERLAYNDGFDSVEDFVKYFSSGDNISGEFRGKIIHWTDLMY